MKPRPAGDENIMVRFTYDLNGILDVDVEVLSNHAKFKKTIINKNMDLSKEEIKEQLKKMEELKKDPRTKEENQYLLALANALYRETSGQLRDYIDSIIRYFDNVLMEGNEQKIDYVRKRLMVVLSNLEAGLYDYSFNEEEYDSEDYNEEEEFLNNMRSGNTEEAQMDKDDLEEDNFLSMLKEPPEDDI